jgi:uncharacterized protein YjbI with pentapeptide repeats
VSSLRSTNWRNEVPYVIALATIACITGAAMKVAEIAGADFSSATLRGHDALATILNFPMI